MGEDIDTSEILLAFAQLSLGLAGFSSIVVALSGSPHSWTPLDSFRIRNMLLVSFLALFVSLLPVVLEQLSMPETSSWRVSLVAIGLVTSIVALTGLRSFRELSAQERLAVRPMWFYSLVATLLVVATIELIASFSSTFEAAGVFSAGLLVLLGLSAYLVFRFLFARPAGGNG